jgi:DnaJ-class molecular chaperone
MRQMQKPCKACDGGGEIAYFRGISRFLLSWKDCPACDGLGYVVEKQEASDDSAFKEEANPKPEQFENP